MSDHPPHDPLYVEARRVLLDALDALKPHLGAVIVVGAQAVYLQTGPSGLAVAPYTTDGDLALDPRLLREAPELETAMRDAGFELRVSADGSTKPGTWTTTRDVEGKKTAIAVDLIVPEAASTGEGRRGARIEGHGNRAARRAVGLEAALVDHSPISISPLDTRDTRCIVAEVAGVAALLITKMHKIHDRIAANRFDRIDDKDAGDVVRLMQVANPSDTSRTFKSLLANERAASATAVALEFMQELFGRRGGQGVEMAQRNLQLGLAPDQVATLCVRFTERALGQ